MVVRISIPLEWLRFEMLTGQHLFDETDPLKGPLSSQGDSSAGAPVPSIQKSRPRWNRSLLRCSMKNPEDRYQTVENLLVELQEFMLKEGIENE